MSVIFGGSADDAQALRELEGVPLGLPGGLELSWLGVSGYRLSYEGVSLFIDPYVSRVPLRSLLLRRLAMPDESMIDRYAGAPGPADDRADALRQLLLTAWSAPGLRAAS